MYDKIIKIIDIKNKCYIYTYLFNIIKQINFSLVAFIHVYILLNILN